MGSDKRDSGFGEGVQRSFALDDAAMFRRLMLDLYRGRCAVTGQSPPRKDAEDALEVFLFQPLCHGGAMTSGNAMVVETAVASLLGKGLILVSDDYFAFAPHPEIVGAAKASEGQCGRPLFLPDDVGLWPDRAMIGYHRSLFRAQ